MYVCPFNRDIYIYIYRREFQAGNLICSSANNGRKSIDATESPEVPLKRSGEASQVIEGKSNTESSPFYPRRNRTKLVACNNSRQYRRGRMSNTIIVKWSWKRWSMRKRRSGPISTKGGKHEVFPNQRLLCKDVDARRIRGVVWREMGQTTAKAITAAVAVERILWPKHPLNSRPHFVRKSSIEIRILSRRSVSQVLNWRGVLLHRKTAVRTSFIWSYSHRRSSTNLVEICCRCGHQRGSLESWLWRHPKHRTRPWPQEN